MSVVVFLLTKCTLCTRHRSRSRSPRRRRHSPSLSPDRRSRSSSFISLERKRVLGKAREEEELEKKRWQQEAELKLIEEETARRVEEAIRKKVNEALNSEEVKKEIEVKIKEGRNKLFDEIAQQLAREKEDALAEARRKEVRPVLAMYMVKDVHATSV
jgi:arginine/glutamate-rich protein 1